MRTYLEENRLDVIKKKARWIMKQANSSVSTPIPCCEENFLYGARLLNQEEPNRVEQSQKGYGWETVTRTESSVLPY